MTRRIKPKPKPWQIEDARERVDAAKHFVREDLRRALPFIDPAHPPDDALRLIDTEREVHRPHDTGLALDDEAGHRLLMRARAGDAQADRALRRFAAVYLRDVRALPIGWAEYVAAVLDGNGPKSKTRTTDHQLTRHVGAAVETILGLKLGFPATRGNDVRAAGTRESACSIISAVLLDLGCILPEWKVQKAWFEYRRGRRERD